MVIAVLVVVGVCPADARAAPELGCCQFYTAASSSAGTRRERRCSDITAAECRLLRPSSSFIRRQHCDTRSHRCVLGPAPNTSTPTLTPTQTPTPTPLEARGCCQVDGVRGVGHAICGNAVRQSTCLGDLTGVPQFCADCACSSHGGDGFTFDVGTCVVYTPTPTVTPTPAERRGCCQLSRLPGAVGTVCGNDIRESTCLDELDGQPTFCPDCECTSHSGAGISLAPGSCLRPRPARRRPHAPHVPHVPHRPSQPGRSR